MTIADSGLPRYVGSDGLMGLLAMLAEDVVPKAEVLELIKRIHIPGYEEARHHFEAAIADGAFEPNTLEGFYGMSEISATIAYAKKKKG